MTEKYGRDTILLQLEFSSMLAILTIDPMMQYGHETCS
jgi:hypothetical protein